MLSTAVRVSFHVLEDEESSTGDGCCLQNTQIRLSVAPLCPVYSSHLSRHTNKPAVLPQNAQHSVTINILFFLQLTEELMQGVKISRSPETFPVCACVHVRRACTVLLVPAGG